MCACVCAGRFLNDINDNAHIENESRRAVEWKGESLLSINTIKKKINKNNGRNREFGMVKEWTKSSKPFEYADLEYHSLSGTVTHLVPLVNCSLMYK